jgi:trk system potassium uptake protein TrkH
MRQLVPVLNVVGFVVALFSLTLAIPLGISWWMQDGAQMAFGEAMGIGVVAGGLLYLLTRRHRRELQPRDGFLLVSLVWALLPLIAALPFLIHFDRMGVPLSFTDAYFEAMSGLTTTGATVFTGIERLPVSINSWRCTLVWIGGMGILVLAVAVLPLLGVGGSQIYRAETPGPMKDEKLTPRITSTAKGLYAIYMGISIICMLSFKAAGMSWLDAYAHMGSTMGLGGFSTTDAGFIGFASPAVDFVAVVFMVIAGINFATHFYAIRHRSLGAYLRCAQTPIYLGLLLGTSLFVSFWLYAYGVYPDVWEALHYGFFNTISVATTTGFANTDYAAWPLVLPIIMLFVSSFATSAGSTGGGIKLIRMIILVKQARREMVRILHPRAVNPVRLAGLPVANKVIFSILAFMLIYGGCIIMMTFALLLTGMDGLTAFSAIFASLNNTGPGLGEVGPAAHYGHLGNVQTWICTFAMLIGRLELFTVLVLFTPEFWRK